MVFLFLCESCERGDHEHCSKGHSAARRVYGGSKCKCFVCSQVKTPGTEITKKDYDGLMKVLNNE